MASCYQKLQSALLYKAVKDISCGDSSSCGTHQQSQCNSNCFMKHIQRTVLCCENQIIFSEASDFTEAACTAFILYYIMNREYPEGAAISLKFVQRQFDLNLPNESRQKDVKRSRTSVPSKIMNLVNKLGLQVETVNPCGVRKSDATQEHS
ncbi:uncharacterized protein LOC144097276 isoform X2 [Amblyomma americanum]